MCIYINMYTWVSLKMRESPKPIGFNIKVNHAPILQIWIQRSQNPMFKQLIFYQYPWTVYLWHPFIFWECSWPSHFNLLPWHPTHLPEIRRCRGVCKVGCKCFEAPFQPWICPWFPLGWFCHKWLWKSGMKKKGDKPEDKSDTAWTDGDWLEWWDNEAG